MGGGVEPAISVVMPVRNGGPWIGRQLDALAATRLDVPWELVVSDNGSTDDTRAVVEQHRDAFPAPIVVVDSAQPPGICHARNAGVAAARASRIAFCDCDDVVDPGWLAGALAGLERYDVVSGKIRELRSVPDPGAPVLHEEIESQDAFLGCNWAVRREAYYAVGGFDETLPSYGCDDAEFTLRARSADLAFGHVPQMLLNFQKTEGFAPIWRKVYRSAVAEAIVWHRHPADFADRIGLRAAVTDLLRLPVDLVRMRRDGQGLRRSVREVVTRIAHLASYREISRQGRVPAQLVFTDPRGNG